MWEEEYINKIRFGVIEDHYDHFWPCQIFIFSSKIEKLLTSVSTKFDKILEIHFVWWTIWYFEVRMTSGQNSVVPKSEGRSAERVKSQNQPHWSIRNQNMSGLPSFNLEKGLFPPYFPSKLSQEVEIWYTNFAGVIDFTYCGFYFENPLRRLTAHKFVFVAWISYVLSLFLAQFPFKFR